MPDPARDPRAADGEASGPVVSSGRAAGCPDEDAILAFVRGDATAADRSSIEDHLAGCTGCRQLVSALAPTSTPAGGRPKRGDTLVRIGEVVADKYEIERVLGQGGMGVVVQANHTTLRKPVALKFLKGSLADRPEVVARFFREARAAAAIDDEHVVRVLDAGRLPDTGEPYLVLELLDGHDLASEVRTRGPLPIEEAVGWVMQACKALSLAHARGIVHRDIKPANLFIARRGDGTRVLKVLDFGIAKVHEALEGGGSGGQTSTGTILGSPSYMAPEQLEGRPTVDGRVDVWALGVVLFELLTGQLPFEGNSVPSICAAILTSPARSLRAVRAEVPPDLEASILLCWAKDPAQRMPSVDALASAIAPFAAVGGTATTQWARPVSTPPPASTPLASSPPAASAPAASTAAAGWRGRWPLLALGALALGGLAAAAYVLVPRGIASPVTPQIEIARTIPPVATTATASAERSAASTTAPAASSAPEATTSARVTPARAARPPPPPTKTATAATAQPASTPAAPPATAKDPVNRDGLLDRK